MDGDASVGGSIRNSTSREQAMTDALERIYLLKKREREIIQDAVQGIRDSIGDIKKALREDYNVTNQVLQARLYSYTLERRAAESGDQITLDAIKEMFKVAPVGTSVRIDDVVGASEQEITDTLTEAKKKGTAAGKGGANFDSCPYPQGSKHREYWEQNWHAAQAKLAKDIKKTPAAESEGDDAPTKH